MPPTSLHPIPPPEPAWPLPTLNIRVDDLSHPGASIFFDAVHPTEALKYAVEASFKWLYATLEKAPTKFVDVSCNRFIHFSTPTLAMHSSLIHSNAACNQSSLSSAPWTALPTPSAPTHTRRFIFLWITSTTVLQGPSMKSWASWFTRWYIATSTMHGGLHREG